MGTDPIDEPQSAAIEQLEQFGLSAYAARTFVALAGLREGTAREVSQVSEVPRTRVYDAVDELHELGLIDVQESSPKRFWSISADTASRMFEREFQQRADVLRTSLDEIHPDEHRVEQRGVWTVGGEPAVTERVLEFLAEAEDEIVYMTVDDLLTPELISELSKAVERGVSIKLGGVSEEVSEQIHNGVDDVTSFESMWMWSDTSAGRLMMVDGRKILVSALVNGSDASLSDPRSESAIWGEGETNSLVVILKAIFAWRLEEIGAD